MQLHQLRYFVHVAELGSFSRAATRLNVTQPALSRQVSLLERELGVPLLHRDGRGTSLTGSGTILFERAVDLLRRVEDARAAVAVSGCAIEGEVRIGLAAWAAQALLPAAVLQCRHEHPLLAIATLESSDAGILEEWLLSGRVDIAVMEASPRISHSLRTVPLLRQRMALVGRAGDPIAGKGDCSFRDIAALPLILPPAGQGARDAIDAAARECGILPQAVAETGSEAVAKALLLRGAGYAILPRQVVAAEIAAGLLWARDLAWPRLEREWLLASAVAQPLRRSGKIVQRMLLAEAQRLQAPAAKTPERPRGAAAVVTPFALPDAIAAAARPRPA